MPGSAWVCLGAGHAVIRQLSVNWVLTRSAKYERNGVMETATSTNELPTFSPWGPHGFTSYVNRGRIQHLPTYDVNDIPANMLDDCPQVDVTPWTRKPIHQTPDGELFAIANTKESIQ